MDVGPPVGAALGASVGGADGSRLGPTVLGSSVERTDGAPLGHGVGSALGLQDGFVGVQVGVYDGPEGALE